MKLNLNIFGNKDNVVTEEKAVTRPLTVDSFFGRVLEAFTGAWQRNITRSREDVLRYFAVFSCISLISGDIAKLSLVRLKKSKLGYVKELGNIPKVLLKPNKYQTWQKFIENWIQSILIHGNAYILKTYDRDKLVELHVINPTLCKPYVTDEGDVYYYLGRSDLAREDFDRYVPANEIIHDRINCFYHPLVGLSPIYACAMSAENGLAIQENSKAFFDNMSRPSGILTSASTIKQETAERLKKAFEENYSKNNLGRIAVLGDGLDYKTLSVSAVDSQLIEQLKWTAENICSAFHVPPFKIGIGSLPANANSEMLNQIYYSDCLQTLITSVESHLNLLDLFEVSDDKLMLDVSDLMRMDTYQKLDSLGKTVKDGWQSPDEARAAVYLPPVEGGNTPYMQQQNYSLRALALRDSTNPLAVAPQPQPPSGTEPPISEPAPTKEVEVFEELYRLINLEIESI